MIIKLAGFNVDINSIAFINEFLKKYPDISETELNNIKRITWTPETISASYARISRDPRHIDELRKEASVEIEKARKSNQSIIFDMGHSSIAEHAVFNIDIINISRLASEFIEKSRLVSFTEKSQRYIKIGTDIYIPEEFKTDKAFLKKYEDLCAELFEAYNHIHDAILPYFTGLYPDMDTKSRKYRDTANLAKEDARYILPLAALTQLGMTINARNFEKMLRKLKSSKIAEFNMISDRLYEEVNGTAPSLVKYFKPTEFEKKDFSFIKEYYKLPEKKASADITLIKADKDIEEKILAAFIFKNSSMDFNAALASSKKISEADRKKIFAQILKDIQFFENIQREFEISDFEFSIVMSGSAFAQFKRHRMATIIDGEYSPDLGVTIPESLIKNSLKDYFIDKIDKIHLLYAEAKNKWGNAADYILSNAHRKNILLKCNLRELTHIIRLRSDKHAQWDIRNISDAIANLVKDCLPSLSGLLKGKDQFIKD